MRARLAAIVGVVALTGVSFAAQQPVPTKTFLVKNPPSGSRKVLLKVKDTAATVVGDPTADGAALRIVLTPGGDQCVTMPASGWSAISTIGFKYKDAALANGPVKVALIKKTPSGTFLLKALLKNGGPTSIAVTPGDPTTTYGTNLTLGTGDEYCGGTATATPKPNDAGTFKVSNDGAPAGCIASCNVTTTSTTTTISTTTSSTATAVTWDPTWSVAGATYSNGNLSISGASTGTKNVRSTVGRSSGKWYWEISATSGDGLTNAGGLGIAEAAMPNNVAYIGSAPSGLSFGYAGSPAYFYNWPGVVIPSGNPPMNSAVTNGNVYMFALDMDAGKLWVGQNGGWYNFGNPATAVSPAASGLSGTVYAAVTFYPNSINAFTANFGASAFSYSVPAGFNAGL